MLHNICSGYVTQVSESWPVGLLFLLVDKNICCGYSLEVPWRGPSNEYHNICFRQEIRKI